MRIFAFHLLNNYTGSPKVLSQLVRAWIDEGFNVRIVTSVRSEGFLSKICGVKYYSNFYQFYNYSVLRFMAYSFSQAILFFRFLFVVKPADIVYVNTNLPFAAALVGRIKGCRVIYHLHETSTRPVILKRFLTWVLSITASEAVCVSNYLAGSENLSGVNTHVIPNCIDDSFYQIAQGFKRNVTVRRNVLMVASLKPYKGIYEFVQLAGANPNLYFRLVLSASEREVYEFVHSISKPQNMEVFSLVRNLHPFYQWADIVLNLSNPDRWIETFGLSILEGMAYGLPAIVPPVGGITEMVTSGVNGFCVSVKSLEELSQRISYILSNNDVYNQFSAEALSRVNKYREADFVRKNLSVLNKETIQ